MLIGVVHSFEPVIGFQGDWPDWSLTLGNDRLGYQSRDLEIQYIDLSA